MNASSIFKKQRIPTLVWSGFGLLIILGFATSLFLLLQLRRTVHEGEAIEAATLNVRAAVRSLHARYMDQELNRALLSPQSGVKVDEYRTNKLKSDERTGELLRTALASTRSEELRRVLLELQKHDKEVTVPLEEEVLALALTDLAAAREMCLTRYLAAQDKNVELAVEAKRLAVAEVAAMSDRSHAETARAQFWSRLAIAAFLGLGIVTAFFLTRAVAALVRQASEAARETSDLMDHSMDIICSISADGRFTKINGACEQTWGYRPEELLGRPYIELVHPDDVEKTNRAAEEIVAGTASGHFENRYLRKDGAVVNMLWAASWSAERQAFFCVAHDTTERRRAEEATRLLHRNHDLIVNSITEGIHWIDSNGRIIFENPAAARMLGWEPSDLIGQLAHLTMHHTRADGTPYPQCECHIYAGLRTGVAQRVDNEVFWRKDGTSFPVEYTTTPLRDENAEIIGTVVVFTDITERKRAEAEHQVISEIVQGVITTSNLDELLDLARRSIGKLLYAENCFVALHNPTTDLMHFEYWVDKLDPVPAPQPVGDGLSGSSYVLRTGRPLLLTNELKTQLHDQGEVQLIGTDSASWLGVPLRTRSRTIGVLAVQHYEKEGAYNQRDLEFLSAVGDQIALAIERKAAEKALQEAEEKYRSIFERSNDGIFQNTPEGRHLSVNPALARMLGFDSPEELIRGRDDIGRQAYADPAMREKFKQALEENGSITGFEYEVYRKDGAKIWVSESARIVRDGEGRALYYEGSVQDITERRRAEAELTRSQLRLAEAQQVAHVGSWELDQVTRKAVWSDELFRLLGFAPGEIEPTYARFLECVHPDDRKAADQFTENVLATRKPASMDVRVVHPDGRLRVLQRRVSVILDDSSKVVRMLGTVQDVTELRQKESELLLAKSAAEAASRAKSEFLANMSHEIRTPMNGIIGMTDLALETDLNRDQREYLGMVKSSAHSLLGLINDILDFSKIEAGKLELESIGFSLRDCIGGMLKPLGLRADQKGLELVADIPSEVPDHLVGDPMRLRQILINLTDNAIKFTERGEVVVKVINQAAANGASHLHFSIADTGIGIPVEKQKAIFEAFAQADGSTTRTHGGTGLGLSIASGLIQKMHGRIWIESKVGEGTTFHFTACLPVQATPARIVTHANLRDLAGLRALVVDDNAVNRRILREMLVNWRMNPTLVESGQAGLDEMLRAVKSESGYQLVLIDAVMPEMDGFALAGKIKDQPELADATVMMLSSAMPTGSSARCATLGIASSLTKPVTQSDLLDAILVAVGRGAEGENPRNLDAGLAGTDLTRSHLRILVAEDNVINRAVATGILEKQGHVLVHAATGREALGAFGDGAFDLILMDVQMPEMDGFEATRQIRELEETIGSHTRIVAMTAHAMAGDLERCLAAGMDDYVSKPLRKEDLLRALVGAGIEKDEDKVETEFLYNREQLLSQCDGDEELMGELVSIFHDNTPQIVRALGEAVEKGDAPALAAQSHKLLSSLGVFGAGRARTLALRLEKHGQQNDFGGAMERFTELERETDKIYAALA